MSPNTQDACSNEGYMDALMASSRPRSLEFLLPVMKSTYCELLRRRLGWLVVCQTMIGTTSAHECLACRLQKRQFSHAVYDDRHPWQLRKLAWKLLPSRDLNEVLCTRSRFVLLSRPSQPLSALQLNMLRLTRPLSIAARRQLASRPLATQVRKISPA